jgi:hypothetical protein
MPVTVTVIRAGLPWTCSSQAELAHALAMECTVDNGFAMPSAPLDDLDIEVLASAVGFRATDEPYGTDYTLRPDIGR